jgi:threonine dehydrogenase-like Zn-dependent dehydrogenase
MGVLAAKEMGAERIIAMSRHKSRQALANEFGAADIVVERGPEGIERVNQLTRGVGADAVLKCVGTARRRVGRPWRAISKARPRACGSARSCIQPCSYSGIDCQAGLNFIGCGSAGREQAISTVVMPAMPLKNEPALSIFFRHSGSRFIGPRP